MRIPNLIERKRNGEELAPHEIRALITGFTRGEIPDYQMSAFAMAVFFQGMTPNETRELTSAMMESGRVLEYPAGSPPKVDKHSTGGIGDKVSLVLAPLLACDEVWVPMISGRGLGITGGTLDKLESIPGFNVNLDERRALRQLEKIGIFMIGQTADICPADKKLYALRDVTGTIPSQPLIVASIMSKKLAENLDRLVLDVKFGSGAFMKTRAEAKKLANAMATVGRQMGVEVSYLLSPTDAPLGRAVGNALEVAEAVETLQGRGPEDLVELTLDLAAKVATAPRAQLGRWLEDGTAWEKFVALVEAQDGDARALEKMAATHNAPVVHPLPADKGGVIRRMDAEAIGRVAHFLGAGRARTADTIDFAVGCSQVKQIGEQVEKDETVMLIHARNPADLDAALALLEQAMGIASAPPPSDRDRDRRGRPRNSNAVTAGKRSGSTRRWSGPRSPALPARNRSRLRDRGVSGWKSVADSSSFWPASRLDMRRSGKTLSPFRRRLPSFRKTKRRSRSQKRRRPNRAGLPLSRTSD